MRLKEGVALSYPSQDAVKVFRQSSLNSTLRHSHPTSTQPSPLAPPSRSSEPRPDRPHFHTQRKHAPPPHMPTSNCI